MTCWACSRSQAVGVAGLIILMSLWTAAAVAWADDKPADSEANIEGWEAVYSLGRLGAPLFRHEFGLGAALVDPTHLFPSIRLISPAVDEEWVEGELATVAYETTGPIAKVRIYYYGGNCRLGGQSRGDFGQVIADMVPNEGIHYWKLPWIDAASFRLRVAGYSDQGERLAEYERTVRFRARELADLPDTCIAIIKRKQRLYYYKDGRVVRMHIVSTAVRGYSTPNMHPGSYSRRRGEMGKVFYKSWAPRSRMYDVVMRYYLAITSSGSHGIHATYPNMYRYLGRPASHGCIRQHRADAKILYSLVPVGTPVYVF